MSVAASEHRITINNYSLVIQAALAGQGVALGWRPLVDDLMERGQLVPALDRTVTTGKGYYLVHKRTSAGTRWRPTNPEPPVTRIMARPR